MYYVESCLQWYKPYNNNSLLNEKNIALVIGLYFTRSCFLFNKLDRQECYHSILLSLLSLSNQLLGIDMFNQKTSYI